jgi:O-methyltransferase
MAARGALAFEELLMTMPNVNGMTRLRSRFDRPVYDVLRQLGLFEPLLRLYRRYSDFRRRGRALDGKGLVPEDALKTCYRQSLACLREKNPSGPIGDYIEFGVCYGSSLACMHDVLVESGECDVRLFGFDSFEGLPDSARTEDTGHWTPGQFRSSLEFTKRLLAKRGVDVERTSLIKGWFEKSLNQDTAANLKLEHAGIIMVDCDLYSSTVQALRFCAPLIRDRAVIIFDDWNSLNLAEQNMGERRAFVEFLNEHPEFETRELSGYHLAAVFLISRRRAATTN